jgi:hypothetical protein
VNRKQQGDIGVAMAIAYYTKNEYVVSTPLTDNARYDLIIELNGIFTRVQCKTTSYAPNKHYIVALRTSGGNQSWNKIVKRVSKDDADKVFAYSLDGKCYEFPPEIFHEKASITLSSKYDKYLVWKI